MDCKSSGLIRVVRPYEDMPVQFHVDYKLQIPSDLHALFRSYNARRISQVLFQNFKMTTSPLSLFKRRKGKSKLLKNQVNLSPQPILAAEMMRCASPQPPGTIFTFDDFNAMKNTLFYQKKLSPYIGNQAVLG